MRLQVGITPVINYYYRLCLTGGNLRITKPCYAYIDILNCGICVKFNVQTPNGHYRILRMEYFQGRLVAFSQNNVCRQGIDFFFFVFNPKLKTLFSIFFFFLLQKYSKYARK